ncbi:polyamine oxidase-like protein [Hapsidospora chrysogenum ATCC 11550]|uniref:Polyamine oxidase-like protein n=1 Tax=Hapsidospora chrysogenum (strain ATCC 11550 / CBS 779.69 / DSM 880 / IAM 14645 / JCM 23072 / IMI 49137) TaxID=857340 RepID=A0A086T3E9_HAPC1|nr:polyamine oxidase-like protein [Hapsidospora chrysogenum ATCC 11550]
MATCAQRGHRNCNSKPHIAVIGAGLAGLRCTDILLQHGFQVTILEARNRLGGRLYQEQLPNGHWVDMGPNWIHGTTDNPILDLAKQTDTDTGSWDDKSYVFDEAGDLFPVDQGGEYANIMWGIVEEAFKHSNKFFGTISPQESLRDFFLRKVVEMIPETEDNWEERRKIVMQVSEMWGAFVGSPISKQSLKFFWLEECIEGENLFCAGTYKKILELIAEPAVSEADIKFNTKAERISRRVSPDEPVRVQTTDGQVLEFDEVVVTSPLGWLKRHMEAFEPELPARLSKAIKSIAYGCLEKVYISFPEAFWMSSDDDAGNVRGFVQWLSPNYTPETNPQRWSQELVELASLSPGSSHPTLLFYTYGAQSEYLTAKVSELKSKKEKDEYLLAFFRPYYSRLPQYSESDPRCQPTACLATSWMRDELAGNGSYCNFQVGLEEGDEDVKVMRHGLPEQGLWFAGEHTAPFVALGTATGAYWSGESVGERIAEAYGV